MKTVVRSIGFFHFYFIFYFFIFYFIHLFFPCFALFCFFISIGCSNEKIDQIRDSACRGLDQITLTEEGGKGT